MEFANWAINLPDYVAKRFEIALEVGKWDNGEPVTTKQEEICREVLQIRNAVAERQCCTVH